MDSTISEKTCDRIVAVVVVMVELVYALWIRPCIESSLCFSEERFSCSKNR